MKLNIFKIISDNNIEYDERIAIENNYISSIMLMIIRIAFVFALILDWFSSDNLADKVPSLIKQPCKCQ